MYINKVILYGNLTRDPELKAIPSGTHVASFGIATNRVYKDAKGARQEASDFHNIVVFGKQAETAAQYLKKGQGVFIEGRLQTRSWEKDGQKQYRTEIVADRVQFGPKSGGSAGGYQSKDQGGAIAGDEESEPPRAPKGEIAYPTEEINPDDIPF
jgi:single-strand DNA-binding protein